jgi:hypothetical protein
VKRTTADPGGTAVAQRGFPLSALLIAIGVAAGIMLVFGLRGGTKPTAAASAALPGPIEARAVERPPQVAAAPRPAPATAAGPADSGDRERQAAAALEATLRRQRLWGRAEVSGGRVDVRSGSCGDPAMAPLIEGERAALRGAGLTRLRCLAQSGAVVFERDL